MKDSIDQTTQTQIYILLPMFSLFIEFQLPGHPLEMTFETEKWENGIVRQKWLLSHCYLYEYVCDII